MTRIRFSETTNCTYQKVYSSSDGKQTNCPEIGKDVSGTFTLEDCKALTCSLNGNAFNYRPLDVNEQPGFCYIKKCDGTRSYTNNPVGWDVYISRGEILLLHYQIYHIYEISV